MTDIYDLVVVGDYCLDLIFTGLPGLPVMGQELYATAFDMLPGGAYNSAVAAHRLGLRVGWATDFGIDEYSQLVLKKTKDEGLDHQLFVLRDKPLRRITVSLSYPSDRAFVTYYDPGPSIPAGILKLLDIKASYLLIPGLVYGRQVELALKYAKAKNVQILMDSNMPGDGATVGNNAVRRIIKLVDCFIVNRQEASLITQTNTLEEALECLGRLCNTVIIKDGANGVYLIEDNSILHVPAIPVDVIDTTGAGDCFNAGYIAAAVRGQSRLRCLQWGNIVGGLSTTARGATKRVIGLDDVSQWLNYYSE